MNGNGLCSLVLPMLRSRLVLVSLVASQSSLVTGR